MFADNKKDKTKLKSRQKQKKMKIDHPTCVLFIEPTSASWDKQVKDDMTEFLQKKLQLASEEQKKFCLDNTDTFQPTILWGLVNSDGSFVPKTRARGVHTCECGVHSANFDFEIADGMYTNGLCAHYMLHHRSEVPQSEINKVLLAMQKNGLIKDPYEEIYKDAKKTMEAEAECVRFDYIKDLIYKLNYQQNDDMFNAIVKLITEKDVPMSRSKPRTRDVWSSQDSEMSLAYGMFRSRYAYKFLQLVVKLLDAAKKTDNSELINQLSFDLDLISSKMFEYQHKYTNEEIKSVLSIRHDHGLTFGFITVPEINVFIRLFSDVSIIKHMIELGLIVDKDSNLHYTLTHSRLDWKADAMKALKGVIVSNKDVAKKRKTTNDDQ